MQETKKETDLLQEDELLRQGYCSKEVLNFLKNCVIANMNVVICGAQGSGRTSLLRYLSQYILPCEKVATIEKYPKIHYKKIHPNSECVELQVKWEFPSCKAIGTAMHLNTDRIIFPEMYCNDIVYFLDCLQIGIGGLTTMYWHDAKTILDLIFRIGLVNGLHMESEEIYSLIDVSVLVRRDTEEKYGIDQVCLFDHVDGKNVNRLIVENGNQISDQIPENVIKKFQRSGIADPFVYSKTAEIGNLIHHTISRKQKGGLVSCEQKQEQ